MWHKSWTPGIVHDDYTRMECGAMAQRRDLFCRSTALAVPLVLVGVVLLAGAVFVSNQVISSRLQLARLEDRREYLEANAAHLQARWNSLTTAETIQERARAEIGLSVPPLPQMVLVQTVPAKHEKAGVWDRIMSRLDGVSPLEAATDPLNSVNGAAMIFLGPGAAQGGNR